MLLRICTKYLAGAALLASATVAQAADLSRPAPAVIPSAASWFVHVGPAGVVFSPSASVAVAGVGVSGSISVPSNIALGADIGYFITPDISASVTLANPPTATVKGKGGVVGTLGTLGKTTYLPPILAVQYHFRQLGMIQPYVGAGVNYTIILGNEDGALANFRVKSNVGFALQAGTDLMFNDHWGAFVDVKHVWLRTNADGTLGGAPVSAKVTLDPTIIHAGLTYRF